MVHRIQITAGDVSVAAELNDSPTAEAILAVLPVQAEGNRWGDEIYFRLPLEQPESANARVDVEVGELAFWPPGSAFCIFFGPTPASHGDQPRAASPVNPIGRTVGDTQQLRTVPDGATVHVESAQ